jgi:hypothetical protein
VVLLQLARVGRPTGRLARRIWWLMREVMVVMAWFPYGGLKQMPDVSFAPSTGQSQR